MVVAVVVVVVVVLVVVVVVVVVLVLLCFIKRAVEGETFGLKRNTCGQNCVGSAVAPEKYKLSARFENETRKYKITLVLLVLHDFDSATCRLGRLKEHI